MIELWQLIKDAGPLALAASFFLVWYLERSRANDERAINAALTERTVTAINAATEAIKELREGIQAIGRSNK